MGENNRQLLRHVQSLAKMIVVKLMGGLGNQMFQYAAGFALAHKHKVPLHLDLSFLERDPQGAWTKRNFELNVFGILPNALEQNELAKFQSTSGRITRLINRFLPLSRNYHYAVEKGQTYQSWFNDLPQNVYLEGFWQNEKYFERVRTELINVFSPKINKPSIISDLEGVIQAKTTISLHVRRGDYVASKEAGAFHGICSPEYYAKAIHYLEQKVGTFQLMIFSDDPQWCANHFTHPHGQIIVSHVENPVWDMYLMSQCHHHIIANSSFSWWGAWLNKRMDAITLLPNQWFASKQASEIGINAKGWILI